jgi:hypothetical protein
VLRRRCGRGRHVRAEGFAVLRKLYRDGATLSDAIYQVLLKGLSLLFVFLHVHCSSQLVMHSVFLVQTSLVNHAFFAETCCRNGTQRGKRYHSEKLRSVST